MAYDKYIGAYADYLDHFCDALPEELREKKLEFLRALKEEHKYFQLFAVLEVFEQEDMAQFTRTLFEEEIAEKSMGKKSSLLLLVMGHLEERERECLAEAYLREDNLTVERARAMGYSVANTMHKCFDNIARYYITLVKTISKAIIAGKNSGAELACEFLGNLEHTLKVSENKNMIPSRLASIPEKQKEEYFVYLREMGAYKAANSFLDRFWKENPNPSDVLFARDIKETPEEEERRIKTLFYCVPSPELLAWGRKYIQKKRECADNGQGHLYTHEQWCDDIFSLPVQDRKGTDEDWESVKKWLDVSKGIDYLKNHPWEEAAPVRLARLPKFDTEKHSYMTEMCCQLTEVIQDWMGIDENAAQKLNDRQLVERLEALGKNNLFSYEENAKKIATYRGYKSLQKILNLDALTKRLYQVEAPEDMVYIYFHSPIWLKEPFNTFVGEITVKINENRTDAETENADEEKNDVVGTVQWLLRDYEFYGEVRYEDKKRKSAVSEERFWLRPRDIYLPLEESTWEKRLEWEYLFIDPDWLQKKQRIVNELAIKPIRTQSGKVIYPPTRCRFRVLGFSEEYENRLLITEVHPVRETGTAEKEENKTLPEKEETDNAIEAEEMTNPIDTQAAEVPVDRKTVFQTDLDAWLEKMRTDRKFYKWEERTDAMGNPVIVEEPLKVYPERTYDDYQIRFEINERIKIAGDFLEIVKLLAEESCEEAAKLIHHCQFRPLANINEFRYIETQHWTNFGLRNWIDEEREARIKWEDTAEVLMNNQEIPADLRLEIYMNTCIRKVYSLEKLIEKNPSIAELLFEDGTGWIVPVKFEGHGYLSDKGYTTKFFMNSVRRKNGSVDLNKQYVIKSDYTFYHKEKIIIPEQVVEKDLKGRNPRGIFVMYATMKSIDRADKTVELNDYFFGSEEVKKQFPWREYKKNYYDLKKLNVAEEGDQRANAALNKQLLDIYDNLKKVEFSMETEHKHTPYKKWCQIAGEMDEVFNSVTRSRDCFDIPMCFKIVALLGEKNAFKDMAPLEELTEEGKRMRADFEEFCKERYARSYDKFMAGIDDDRPSSISFMCAVFYLSHLQLLVEESRFIEDVKLKHYMKDADKVEAEIHKCKTDKLQKLIDDKQNFWQGMSEARAEAKENKS